jgi:hypothetical protein
MGGKPRKKPVKLSELSDAEKGERLALYARRLAGGDGAGMVEMMLGVAVRLAYICKYDPVEVRALIEANITDVAEMTDWDACMSLPGIVQMLREHVRIAHGEDPSPMGICAMLTAASMDTAARCEIPLEELQAMFTDFKEKFEEEQKERVIN